MFETPIQPDPTTPGNARPSMQPEGLTMADLLDIMIEAGASDLHIKPGSPPGIRVDGRLLPVEGAARLGADDSLRLVSELVDERDQEALEAGAELDFSIAFGRHTRFRVNVYRQRGSLAAVLRCIPVEIPKLEDLDFPDVVRDLCHQPNGLILVTGPTGSGKSTTLAAMVDYINRTRQGHILTLEDPIEFLHADRSCFVSQREIGSDSATFSTALRAALREDPDYILVGEMRDLETISLAMTAAETGHLVLATLHTANAAQSVDRIIDVFPHESKQQVRTQLAATLRGVVSQTLVPRKDGGRVCAQEIMIGTDAVSGCIREGKTHQIVNMLQTGRSVGMQTLDAHLARLVEADLIEESDALARAQNPTTLAGMLGRDETDETRPRSRSEARERPAVRPRPTREAPPRDGSGEPAECGFQQFRNRRLVEARSA